MSRSDLVAADLEKPHWGNFQANVRFLDETGLLEGSPAILEIGCGKGGILDHLLRRDRRAVGVDHDHEVVADGRALFGPLPVAVADGNRLPFPDACFDLVLSFDVFEHIPDSDAHLREVRRVLRPAGHYLLQTPNRWTNVLFEPIRFARKYGLRHSFDFLDYPHHCSLHSYRQLRARLAAAGFAARFYRIPVVNRFFRDKVRRFLGWPGLRLLEVIDPDRLPLALRTNFFVAARRL